MIRNIWAVGRNYADHAKEMNSDIPTQPLIFLKAGSCALFSQEVSLPSWVQDVHHEVELALRLDEALNVDAFGVALDLTERKVQTAMKAKGQPWTLAKSFTHSCPLSKFESLSSLEEVSDLTLSLEVNGELRQKASTSEMIFSSLQLLDFIKGHFPVCPGDLILTGTPAGVGPIRRGDRLLARLGSQIQHSWNVV